MLSLKYSFDPKIYIINLNFTLFSIYSQQRLFSSWVFAMILLMIIASTISIRCLRVTIIGMQLTDARELLSVWHPVLIANWSMLHLLLLLTIHWYTWVMYGMVWLLLSISYDWSNQTTWPRCILISTAATSHRGILFNLGISRVLVILTILSG